MTSVNYKLLYGVGEMTRLFEVERDTVKTWAYVFADYLSKYANPAKGKERKFNLSDVRVLSYIFSYWEEEPDIECIKMGLNSNSHYDNELIDNELIKITPFIFDIPEEIDETWKHGAFYDGLSEFADLFMIADAYKLAGDSVVDAALKNEQCLELFCPAVYNYRHATELYLKAVTNKREKSHDLIALLDSLRELLRKDFSAIWPDWFEKIIRVFNDFDPNGEAFRYGTDSNISEMFIDFALMKKQVGWIAEIFRRIRSYQLYGR